MHYLGLPGAQVPDRLHHGASGLWPSDVERRDHGRNSHRDIGVHGGGKEKDFLPTDIWLLGFIGRPVYLTLLIRTTSLFTAPRATNSSCLAAGIRNVPEL